MLLCHQAFLSLLFLGQPLLSTPQSEPTSLTRPGHAIDTAQMASYTAPREPYYSAYTGVATKDDQFDHLIRQVDKYHIINGFWCFQTDSDASIAYRLGFKDPESILFAEDRGDGPTDTIELRWVPGRSDAYQVPRRGTAKHHLEIISEERTMLGLPASFKDEIPVYTVDNLGKLLSYRTDKHNEQIPSSYQSAGQVETGVPAAPRGSSTKVSQHRKRSSTSAAPSESGVNAELGSSPGRVASPHGGRTPRPTGPTSASDDAKPVAQRASSNHTFPVQGSTTPTASFHNNSLTLSSIPNPSISPAQLYGSIEAHQPRRLPSTLRSTDGSSPPTPYHSPYAYNPAQYIPQSPGYGSNTPSSTSAVAQPARSPSFASSDVQPATSGDTLNQVKAVTSGYSLGIPGVPIPDMETFYDSNAIDHLAETAREATLHEGSVVEHPNTHGDTSEQDNEGSIPVSTLETPIVPTLGKEKSLKSYQASFRGKVYDGPQTPAPPLIVPAPKSPVKLEEWLDTSMDDASLIHPTAESPDEHVEGQDASIVDAPLTNPVAEHPTKLVEGLDTSMDNGELFSFSDELSPAHKDGHGSTHGAELPTAAGEVPHLREQSDLSINGDGALTILIDPLDLFIPMHEMVIDLNCPLLVAPFPCLDCGELEGHRFDCNIGSLFPSSCSTPT